MTTRGLHTSLKPLHARLVRPIEYMSLEQSPRARRSSILVVEDDPAIAEVEKEILEFSGYHVELASTGSEGRSALERTRPDLVILDLMLPDIDGLVMLANIRTNSDVPILVCSATTSQWDTILALKLGADDFVGKPFDADALEARVEAVLRRSQHVAEPPTHSDGGFSHTPHPRRARRYIA